MAQDLTQATLEYAVRLGDDALIIGHRLSEWASRAPFLEEDLALQNVALDYIGRARMFYDYAAKLSDGKTEDDFAYLRDARQFSNLLIHELPRGDFAFNMTRQLLVDVYYSLYLQGLMQSTDAELAGIAAKAAKETRYHLRRSHEWTLRLGDGSEESHQRMVNALDELWGYTHELFDSDELETQLAEAGVGVANAELRDAWKAQVSDILQQATLTVPEDSWAVRGGRQGYHSENLGHILSEMQSLHRAYPGVTW